MTPAILREALIAQGGSVPLDTFLDGRTKIQISAIRESMSDLVDWGLAVDHGNAWQALHGTGKAVATAKHVRAERKGQRPLGVLQRMSERCLAGGKASGAKQKAMMAARIDTLVERLREGVPPRLLKGCSPRDLRYYKKSRPADYARLKEAIEVGKECVQLSA